MGMSVRPVCKVSDHGKAFAVTRPGHVLAPPPFATFEIAPRRSARQGSQTGRFL